MRTWFITGISRGLGRAIAQAALIEGDTVIGTARDTAPDLASGPGKLHVVTLDVTDCEAVDRAVGVAATRVCRTTAARRSGWGLGSPGSVWGWRSDRSGWRLSSDGREA